MTEELFRFGQQVLAAQPFSVMCDVWSVTNGAEQLCAAAQRTIVAAQTENKLS